MRTVYGCVCAVVMAGLATPIVLDGRLEPVVMGLPFALWWTAAGVLVSFAALVTAHIALGGEEPDP